MIHTPLTTKKPFIHLELSHFISSFINAQIQRIEGNAGQ